MASPQKENGFTPIANELLESLLKWQGPGRVKDFVLAIMRETYGWSEKSRVIPGHRFGTLLQISERRVRQLREQALACRIITYSPTEGYAVQKDFELWVDAGYQSKPLGEATLRRMAEGGSSAEPPSAEPPAERENHLPQNHLPPDAEPPSAEPPSVAVAGDESGAEGGTSAKAEGGSAPPPKNPLIGVKQESKNTFPAAVAAGQSTAVALPMDVPKAEKQSRSPEKDTEVQAAIRRCWEACGFESTPGGAGYAELVKAIKACGHETARTRLADRLASFSADRDQTADPWEWFKLTCREQLRTRYLWDPTHPNYKGPRKPRVPAPGTFMVNGDGTLYPQKDWTDLDAIEIRSLMDAGNWVPEKGCTVTPHRGFCCIDGHYYRGEVWPDPAGDVMLP